ncbi:MAG TPA: ankyrin repeat domain-containing protein [Leptospiraceae bacterium]|nr:ankyrin repeat domain-containing protein [Leptospirales bacterium]HMU84405.1 ankyrin repeat domain-containing protein [Leptospiraceae bacterium]HMX57361.1 ankyrin repeat domain-containing protein [Leptospiraceae bacterium]HNJ02671.1 ankyrin repeat domain-containing protein [Leptospiraceae bacterium]HNJ33932.1 ankyrin repeat domain-containing protein [Leptospiraceae bacterium]
MAVVKTTDQWLAHASDFFAKENWIGALSSLRNVLRMDVRNLNAWHMGSDVLMRQDRMYDARLYARALFRFASKQGNAAEIEFAKKRIEEVDEYFATYHRRMGETDLTHFAARGDLAKVRELLDAGANINECNRTGWTPLHRAAEMSHPEMVRLLIEKGANIEALDALGETPLITACRFRNAQVVSEFIAHGSNVNHRSREKHSALWYAISYLKDATIVRLLLDAGADANETYEYGDNPLLLAVSAQAPSVIDLLLPLTEDLERINQHQVCALHFAASYDDVHLVTQLLARGVNVNLKNPSGYTALIWAAQSNSIKVAPILLEHGADVAAKNTYGETAVSIAEQKDHQEMLRLFAKTGSRIKGE